MQPKNSDGKIEKPEETFVKFFNYHTLQASTEEGEKSLRAIESITHKDKNQFNPQLANGTSLYSLSNNNLVITEKNPHYSGAKISLEKVKEILKDMSNKWAGISRSNSALSEKGQRTLTGRDQGGGATDKEIFQDFLNSTPMSDIETFKRHHTNPRANTVEINRIIEENKDTSTNQEKDGWNALKIKLQTFLHKNYKDEDEFDPGKNGIRSPNGGDGETHWYEIAVNAEEVQKGGGKKKKPHKYMKNKKTKKKKKKKNKSKSKSKSKKKTKSNISSLPESVSSFLTPFRRAFGTKKTKKRTKKRGTKKKRTTRYTQGRMKRKAGFFGFAAPGVGGGNGILYV